MLTNFHVYYNNIMRALVSKCLRSKEVQWVPLNIIPSVHENMTLSGIFYYPMYGSYRGYRGTIGPV